jgi:SpoVK/Ycf46/Vps4 family AAA+-type ATPase
MGSKPPLPHPISHRYFSVRSLRLHASSEWFANHQRAYRTVFDESELSELHLELNLVNRLHELEDWIFTCEFRAYHFSGKEISRFVSHTRISQVDPLPVVRERYILDQSRIRWHRGSYCWEVWHENNCIASQNFFVVDGGTLDGENNPYFQLESVKLFEGGSNEGPTSRRQYVNQLAADHTRFIWVELRAENLRYKDCNWPLELEFNFYAHNGRLKASIPKLVQVSVDQQLIELCVAWGGDQPGYWTVGNYRLDVLFMDQIIHSLHFGVVHQAKHELVAEPLVSVRTKALPAESTYQSSEELSKALQTLDHMIGLDDIKHKVREYITYLQFLKVRAENGIADDEPINLHSIFIGNPGTGKTTIAQLIGSIYKALGLLSKGHVHEVDRSDLVGEFIGQTAPKTKEAIEKAQGGILFIDEAYSLARKGDDTKDFGKEVIEILVREMTDPKREFAVIVAGYPEEMSHFLEYNPGLRSRFNQQYSFPDYTPQQLIEIAEVMANSKRVQLRADARETLYLRLVEAYRNRDRTFGNARYVKSLIEAAKMNLGLRLMRDYDPNRVTAAQLTTLIKEDIDRIFQMNIRRPAHIPVDENLLRISLREHQQLIGLDLVKKEVDELVKLVRFYSEIGKNFKDDFNLHALFLGNPGTGKTTVARQFSSILKALGLLERGHLVECSRQDLVAGYAGQTAIRTSEVIDTAIGGTLFIDEAYTLILDEYDAFGREAVATLLKRMEDQRGEFVVIAAGYPANMEKFLQSNPGLKSRFDRVFYFEDYDAGQLVQIMDSLFGQHNLVLEADAREHLVHYFDQVTRYRDQYFGNARVVRNMSEKVIKNQHLRLALMEPSLRDEQKLHQIILADVQEFVAPVPKALEPKIGFRSSSP